MTTGNVLLVLDGAVVAAPRSVAGGNTVGDVVVESGGGAHFASKHLGAARVEELALGLDLSLSKELDEWIGASLTGRFFRKDGSLQTVDASGDVKAVWHFTGALITEIGIPACDASSKDPAYLTVKLAPERVASAPAAGKLAVPQLRRGQWVASRFRLEIDGLDATRVTRIDPFAVRAAVEAGEKPRDPEVDLGALAFPNLRVALPPNRSRTWHEWFEAFVVEGRHGHEHERNGTLTFLSADLTHVFTEVRLFGLGIFGLAPDDAGRLVADLYCQRFELGSVRAD